MRPLRNTAIGLGLVAVLAGGWWAWTKANQPHNVIIFVADGLRSEMVTDETAPALAAVRAEGVDFANSHSIYPTLTTVNASAIATGHYPADNGDFGNIIGLDSALPSPFLTTEDYTGAIFAADRFGPIPGALPTSKVHMGGGTALTLPPSIVVAFRSEAVACPRVRPEQCGVDVSDTDLQQGQGTHGSFGRQDTHNFMAAVGPDFKKGFKDPSPVSNADLGVTVAKLFGLDLHPKGKAVGRVLGEALLKDGKPVPATARVERSAPAANGFVTVLNAQDAGGAPYFDAAGMPGRTLGLKP